MSDDRTFNSGNIIHQVIREDYLLSVPTQAPTLLDRLQHQGTLDGTPLGRSWSVSAALPVSYDVRLTRRMFDPANEDFRHHVFGGPLRRRLIIVEQRVFDLFGTRLTDYLACHALPAELVCISADEAVKDIDLSLRIIDAIDEFGIDRRHEPIVAIGGGVLLDIVGWAASLYRRGTPYIRIPTTLIGLVDASVGIKTGVNHNGHKNRLGAYHPPILALLDPEFLITLPARHISNGLAEIAKMGLMCDARLWSVLADQAEQLVASGLGSKDPAYAGVGHEVLARAVHSMLVELQPNLWEKNLERLVDFGHSFSPTLEMAALPMLLHGEAVAVDMAISCALSAGRGLLSEFNLREILRTFRRLGLPLSHPTCTTSLLDEGLRDTVRHRGGRQRLPVPVRPGASVFLEGVTVDELDRAVRRVNDAGSTNDADR